MGIFSKLFSPSINIQQADLSVLKCDVHSHLIPGIDDGATDLENSLEMISKFKKWGYLKIITTPHIMSDYYKNTPEIILSGLEKLKEAIVKAGIQIEIEAAAEYYLDYDFEKKIKEKKLLTFGNNYVLFELPFLNPPDNLYHAIFEMLMNGYKPVLAHPERYAYWYRDFNKYVELREKGVLFQLNINSLTGHYSLETKKIAEKLIDADMIDMLGSDCHNMNHISLIEKCRGEKYLHKLINNPKLRNKNL